MGEIMLDIIGLITIYIVIRNSKGKNWKQRARDSYMGTKIILSSVVLPILAISSVILVFEISKLPIEKTVLDSLGILYLVVLIFTSLLWFEYVIKGWKKIEEVPKNA